MRNKFEDTKQAINELNRINKHYLEQRRFFPNDIVDLDFKPNPLQYDDFNRTFDTPRELEDGFDFLEFDNVRFERYCELLSQESPTRIPDSFHAMMRRDQLVAKRPEVRARLYS